MINRLPMWAQPILQYAATALPLPADMTAAAYTLLDDSGVEWQLEFQSCPDQLVIHCQLADDGLHRDNDGLRALLALHHAPHQMQGACVALDLHSGVLRLVQTHSHDSPALNDLPDLLRRLQHLRQHLTSLL